MNAPDTLDLHNRQIESDYNNKPYTSKAFSYSAPGHLRAAAHLYGMETVPLAQARVLELGCASGGNLLPFALAYPQAQAVGVDLSPVQIGQGQQILNDLGVNNLQLHALDLTRITPEFGQFDYIIVHGVFSWVPPEVKQAILRICRENLSPLGLAYVSYNTYPGWKAGDVVRDAMLMHSHGAQDDDERLARARAMLELLSDGLAEANRLAPSVREVAHGLKAQSDYYLLHEYLEHINTPCYFVEFADMAARQGLAYLGDAEPQSELGASYGQNVQLNLSLTALGQPKVMRQQYLDFAVGRNFRKSLLTHQERVDGALFQPDMARLRDLRFAASYAPMPRDEQPGRAYRNTTGRIVRSTLAPMHAVIDTLSQAWPRSVTFGQLCEAVATLAPQTEDPAAATQEQLLFLFQRSLLRYGLEPARYDLPSDGATRLLSSFQYLHSHGQDPAFSTGCFNFWHEAVGLQLDAAQRWLLPHLAEGADAAQATRLLARALQRGTVPGPDGADLSGQRNLEPTAQRLVQQTLTQLRRCGLVIDAPPALATED